VSPVFWCHELNTATHEEMGRDPCQRRHTFHVIHLRFSGPHKNHLRSTREQKKSSTRTHNELEVSKE
jgi:hypothetical protein